MPISYKGWIIRIIPSNATILISVPDGISWLALADQEESPTLIRQLPLLTSSVRKTVCPTSCFSL